MFVGSEKKITFGDSSTLALFRGFSSVSQLASQQTSLPILSSCSCLQIVEDQSAVPEKRDFLKLKWVFIEAGTILVFNTNFKDKDSRKRWRMPRNY